MESQFVTNVWHQKRGWEYVLLAPPKNRTQFQTRSMVSIEYVLFFIIINLDNHELAHHQDRPLRYTS